MPYLCIRIKTDKNMKRTIAFFAALLLALAPAAADNDKAVTTDQLPAAARELISNYFPGEKVAYAKLERDFPESGYEVVFTSSRKLEFKRNGQWKKISCRYSAVPEQLVPAGMMAKVRELYPDATVTEIERDRRSTELKLNNRIELTFDRKGLLMEIDN